MECMFLLLDISMVFFKVSKLVMKISHLIITVRWDLMRAALLFTLYIDRKNHHGSAWVFFSDQLLLLFFSG